MNIAFQVSKAPVGSADYWSMLQSHVNGPENAYFTSQALGRSDTSEFERFTHFCRHGGMSWFKNNCCL